jgi:hypothetical protein
MHYFSSVVLCGLLWFKFFAFLISAHLRKSAANAFAFPIPHD